MIIHVENNTILMPVGYQVKIRSDNFLIVKKAPPELHQFETSHIIFFYILLILILISLERFSNKSMQILNICHIDVGDGCWRPNVVTDLIH